MARKTTYRSRHLSETGASETIRKERIPIPPALQQEFLDGKVLLIDKPLHWTSFDMVRKLRGLLQIKKIGHAGTLDPLATGLLIVCTGKMTKQINEFMAQEKEYTGHITLGATTPTYDLESVPENLVETAPISQEVLQAATITFTGTIQQKPPIYSAIKKDGVAAYELARRGEEVEMKSREITISEFSITSVEWPVVGFKVVCSTGTYIRSLAHDFGQQLGCGGYLSSLRRTRIGAFLVEEATSLESLEAIILQAHQNG